MTDTKLREKAAALIAFTQLGPRFIEWVQAVTEALAPAPEKAAEVECPNCGQQIAYEHLHRDSWMDRAGYVQTRYVCQRQQPAQGRKVREFIDRYEVYVCTDKGKKLRADALAECDAAEGKVAG